MAGVKIYVYTTPIAQGRARFCTATHRAYDPPRSRAYKDYVSARAREAYRGEPLTGPLYLGLEINLGTPKSWPRKAKEAAWAGDIWPTSRPDSSNYLKGVEDALNGIVYVDDSQIVQHMVLRRYCQAGDDPFIYINVEPLSKNSLSGGTG